MGTLQHSTGQLEGASHLLDEAEEDMQAEKEGVCGYQHIPFSLVTMARQ